jgi:GWxTD domain-containing protein
MRPLAPGRLATAAVLATTLALSACGNWQRVGEVDKPNTESEVSQLFDPAGLYSRLGRLVATGPVNYVGTVAYAAGPADSTTAIVAISLPNRVFSFERSGNGFGAHYRIEYEFDRPGAPPIQVGSTKALVVGSFEETHRTDESVVEQQKINLAPGVYTLTVRVRDLVSATTGTGILRTTAPVFGPGSYTAPMLVYSVRGRATRNDSLALLLNPRGTMSYGGDTLLIYVEGTGFTRPTDLPVEIRDSRDSVVLSRQAHFSGNGRIEGVVVRIAPDSAPLGELDIAVGPDPAAGGRSSAPEKFAVTTGGDQVHLTKALVSFSAAWVVTNFDDLLALLRYFGQDHRVEAMRRAKASDRISLWQDFVKATDPDPTTPENEALDQYFGRIAIANERFHETGKAGWRTDRGEVFITIGDPDEAHDQSGQLQNPLRFFIWFYQQYNITLYFQDLTGFGHYELTPASRSDFDRIRLRVHPEGR